MYGQAMKAGESAGFLYQRIKVHACDYVNPTS